MNQTTTFELHCSNRLGESACLRLRELSLGVILVVSGADRAHAQSGDDSQQPSESTVELGEIVVEGRADSLVGLSQTASQGVTGQEQLEDRPILRPAEVLETIPGLIATQHSGSGKANQYFLRGFNLDHGTDFATSFDGIPMNLPTHGHGQGYLDLNFLIPELIDTVAFKKGPYFSEVGDFASAGASSIQTIDRLERGIVKGSVGEDDFYRALLANSSEIGNGELLYALDAQNYDGPFVEPEDFQKLSGILKHTVGDDRNGYQFEALGYTADWTATDQIARRAVDQGLVSRFGTLDPTDGGETDRYTLGASWWNTGSRDARTQANVYAAYYRLNLFSDFTYFLDDPVNGDQFEQVDRRVYGGANVSHEWFTDWFGQGNTNTVGAQLRHDQILEVALFDTDDRERLSTTRDDEVAETSLGVYLDNETQWLDKLRTIVGLRGDVFRFDVDSQTIDANSGTKTDFIASPKVGLILGPWYDTEYYLNGGFGYHSNDARGTTIQLDPSSGEPVQQVEPLVRSKGAEIGARTAIVPGLNSSLALFYLELDSELVFVGDAGGTEASRRSRRIGVEWNNFYQVTDWLSLDFDMALTDAEFTGDDPAGDEIPNNVDQVIAAGISIDLPSGPFGSLRVRHSGPRPLTEDGSVESDATNLVNLQAGYRYKQFSVELDVLNLLDADDSDISYFYTSRLPGEPAAGVDDTHFHPIESRTARLYATWRF